MLVPMLRGRFRNWVAALIGMFLVVYLASWIVMPRLGMSQELHFVGNCYTGYVEFIDSQGSTCSSGASNPVGFPLAIHPGPVLENLLTIAIDILPVIVMVTLLGLAFSKHKVVEPKDKN